MASEEPKRQAPQGDRSADGTTNGSPQTESLSRPPLRRPAWFTRLLPDGIRERLFLLIVLALAPVLILQGWIYYQRHALRRNDALDTELEVAQGVATTFTSHLNDMHRQLHTVGQAILTFDPYTDAKARHLFDTVAEQYPTIYNISWIDTQGIVVVSSLPALVGRDLSARAYFQQVVAGQSWSLGDLMPRGSVTGSPLFAIARAIHDEQGHLRGVVAAAVEPTRLGIRTFAVERPADGAYAIFDRRGVLVYWNPETPLTWEQRTAERGSDPLLQRALKGHAVRGTVTSVLAGGRCVAAYVPIPGIDWVVGASRPAHVVLGPVRLALVREAAFGLLVTLSAFLVAYLIARTIADPLRRLEQEARMLGEGRIRPSDGPEGPMEVRRLHGTMAQMATELIDRAESLRRSEERFRKLFEADLIGVYVTRPDGTFLDCNDKMVKMLGYDSREEVLRYRSADFYLDPEFRREAVRVLQRDGIFPGREGLLRRKDGTIVHALGFAVLLTDEQTGAPYVQGIAVDITERKQAEEALQELTRTLDARVAQRTAELERRARQLQKLALELSQAEERERRRLAEILHDDLQQQLAAAKFHLGRLAHRVKGDISLREAADKAEGMIKEAIAKSRSLSHELSPALLYHGDFSETIEWLANQVGSQHGLAVHVDAHGPVEVSSDSVRTFLFRTAREALFNIVKHAEVREAWMRLRRRRGWVCLCIRDEGRGFDPKGLGQAAGFGLLSTRERVELLGGRMKIRSAPGRGSTILITVPDAQTSPAPLPLEGAPRVAAPGPRLRVLLADDHKVVREGLATLMNEQGDLEVVGQAANGQEAVELARRLEPDVVVMDVAMPVMEGDEATRRIKQYLPRTRIVGLSMFAEPGLVERMRRAGAEGYVIKTAPPEELLAAVRARSGCAGIL